jgi:transposase
LKSYLLGRKRESKFLNLFVLLPPIPYRCGSRMKSKELTTEQRSEIVGMRMGGASLREVAAKFKRPLSTVNSIINKKKETGTVTNIPRSGRPTIFTERGLRELKQAALGNRRSSLADITNTITTQASRSTVRRELKDMGFRCRVAPKKPFLNEKHKADRLAFAQAHRHWTIEDWSRVIWTDESSFELGKLTRTVRVWRRAYEKYYPDCLAPTFKSGRVSVMVWGAFTATSKSNLIQMPVGRRKAVDFTEIIYDGELEDYYFSHHDLEPPILMEDGAPTHTAAVSAVWRDLRGMKKLRWPAQSPDLNPIENLWYICKTRLQKKARPHNKEDLWLEVEKTWKELTQESLALLVQSMPERIEDIIKAKGGSIRW